MQVTLRRCRCTRTDTARLDHGCPQAACFCHEAVQEQQSCAMCILQCMMCIQGDIKVNFWGEWKTHGPVRRSQSANKACIVGRNATELQAGNRTSPVSAEMATGSPKPSRVASESAPCTPAYQRSTVHLSTGAALLLLVQAAGHLCVCHSLYTIFHHPCWCNEHWQ